MRRDLGGEVAKMARAQMKKQLGSDLIGYTTVIDEIGESPEEPSYDELSGGSWPINSFKTMTKKPILEGSLKVSNSSGSTVYTEGIHYSVNYPLGRVTNVSMPTSGTFRFQYFYREGGSGTGVTDHGNLTGREDDDHAIYALSDGTRLRVAASKPSSPSVGQIWRSADVLKYWDGVEDRTFVAVAATHYHQDHAGVQHGHPGATPTNAGFMSAAQALQFESMENSGGSGGGMRFATLLKFGLHRS